MEYLPQQAQLMKHASIDLCNCKHTELEQCMSMLFTLCDSHQSPIAISTIPYLIIIRTTHTFVAFYSLDCMHCMLK